jgi:ATP-dependent RNA helicase RhlE
MAFRSLHLIDPLVAAVAGEGYSQPTPIQKQAIPSVLAGRDVCGVAQTGTGKTAAFALPILQLLAGRPRHGRHPRVLVLAPTRELASQIGESFSTYGRGVPITNTVIFGGVGQDPQVKAVRRGVDVLIATPGRLLDLMGQKHIDLSGIEILVLDEADRMLDMGFIHDVRRIIHAVPVKRQTLFFSATMPPEVVALGKSILHDPVRVEVTPPATTAEKVEHSIYFVERGDKRRLLTHLLADPALARVLVFTRTKHGANRVVKDLGTDHIAAEPIHGNKSQSARERALAGFKAGTTRVLVATDIAARGIDVDGITHVVNYDLPNIPDTYVHRIGRTARAGASGTAISFCDTEERAFLRDIERTIGMKIPHAATPALPARPAAAPRPQHHAAPRPPQQHHAAPRPSQQQHAAPRPQQPLQATPRHAVPAARPAAPGLGRRRRRSFGSIRK